MGSVVEFRSQPLNINQLIEDDFYARRAIAQAMSQDEFLIPYDSFFLSKPRGTSPLRTPARRGRRLSSQARRPRLLSDIQGALVIAFELYALAAALALPVLIYLWGRS